MTFAASDSVSVAVSIGSLIVAAIAIVGAFAGTIYQARADARLEAKKWFREQCRDLYVEVLEYLKELHAWVARAVEALDQQLLGNEKLEVGTAAAFGEPSAIDARLLARVELMSPDLYLLITSINTNAREIFFQTAGLDIDRTRTAMDKTLNQIESAKTLMMKDLKAPI